MGKTTVEKQTLPYASRRDASTILKLIRDRREPKPLNDESKLSTLEIGSPRYVLNLLRTLEIIDENGAIIESDSGPQRYC